MVHRNPLSNHDEIQKPQSTISSYANIVEISGMCLHEYIPILCYSPSSFSLVWMSPNYPWVCISAAEFNTQLNMAMLYASPDGPLPSRLKSTIHSADCLTRVFLGEVWDGFLVTKHLVSTEHVFHLTPFSCHRSLCSNTFSGKRYQFKKCMKPLYLTKLSKPSGTQILASYLYCSIGAV